MGILVFKKKNFEILKHLVFDSIVLFEDIKNITLSENKEVILNIERRVFENVKRKKFLFFWDKTYFMGKHSQLIFNNVKSFNVNKNKIDGNLSNDFILDITYDSKSMTLSMFTVQCNDVLIIEFEDELLLSLIDIEESSVGAGSSFGKVGFTKEEWANYSKINL